MTVTLSFHGGAGTVTGSRHLVDADGSRIQIDAGLFQGLKELRLLNWRKPPYEPSSVARLLLTHAHIDHSGALPRFVRDGYAGPILSTAGTRDLAAILLLDSAKIQEEDAEYANRKGFSKHRPALPLYTTEDAERALKQFVAVPYDEWQDLGSGARARFVNAGHILGSAFIELRVPDGAGELALVFSGDVGRYDMPLHVDPLPPPACDALVVEATYGDRSHGEATLEEQIAEPFTRTLERGHVVLIPAFAVGRTQQLTLMLRELMNEGRLMEVPIHIDSPMAIDATRIYSRHLNEHNLDAEVLEDGRSRLFPRNVHLHRSVEESKRLNKMEGPRIIVASSGMLTGGRILHHLKRRLPEPGNLLVLAGYQPAGTRGRKLLEGAKSLRIHGRDVPVRCKFMSISGLSAHADREELLRWIGSAEAPPKRVFVVHGEPDAAEAFAASISAQLGRPTEVPALDDRFTLTP